MRWLPFVLLIGLSSAPIPALARASASPATVAQAKQAIRSQFKKFARALEDGDAKTVANIYAPDAILLLPNMKPIEGRPALYALFAESFKQFDTVSYKYTVHQVEVAGNWAFRWGTATQVTHPKTDNMGPKTQKVHLKFVDVWERGSDGEWHIYRDSSVIDMPAELRKLIKNCVQAKQGGT